MYVKILGCPKDSNYLDENNENKYKFQAKGLWITEFVDLRSKVYSYLAADDEV